MLCLEWRVSLCFWRCSLHWRGLVPSSGDTGCPSQQLLAGLAAAGPPNQAEPPLQSWAHRMAGQSESRKVVEVLMDLLVSPQLLPCGQTPLRAGETGSAGAFCLIQWINTTRNFDYGARCYSCVDSRHFWFRIVVFSMLQTLVLTANLCFWVGWASTETKDWERFSFFTNWEKQMHSRRTWIPLMSQNREENLCFSVL